MIKKIFTLSLALQASILTTSAMAYTMPNGASAGWNLEQCAQDHLNVNFYGCYSSADLTADRMDRVTHEKLGTVKVRLVTKIEKNDHTSDSLGVGYCKAETHPFHINQDIIVGNEVLYPFPAFYVNSMKIGVQQHAYEWDSEAARCTSRFDFIRTSETSFKFISRQSGAAIDFANIIYVIQNNGSVEYNKLLTRR